MRFFFVIFSFLFSLSLLAQSSDIPMGNDAYRIYDRLEIKCGIESPIHSSLKYYSRKDMVKFVQMVENSGVALSDKDYKDLQYLIDDSNEFIEEFFTEENFGTGDYEKKYVDSIFYTVEEKKASNKSQSRLKYSERSPVLRHFFKTPANFFELNTDQFMLKVNPVINSKFGKDIEDNDNIIFQNTRGIEIRGLIDQKIYFYTNLYETQGRFNDFLMQKIGRDFAIPGFGSYKGFTSSVSDQFSGWDFPNSQAYVGVNVSKNVAIELGHNRHFIGNGYSSLLLSDYSNNYFYLKFSTKIWKFHYQNIFAELAPISAIQNSGDELLPKKYMANHYLSFKPSKNFEIGLFETVIFSRENHFEFQYLNPIILYRTVEFFLDSPDNVIIGLNAKYNLLKSFSLYGQFIIDEFSLSEIRDNSGWWANKYGMQLGLKYIDALGIDHLDAQFEYNAVRPYTYGQTRPLENFPEFSVSNYSHFNQTLAHPLGANFREYVALLNYTPINRLQITARFLHANYGTSLDGVNWGNNVLLTSDNIPMDYGNEIGQGVETTINQIGVDISYQFFHNYYIDVHALMRKSDSALDNFDVTDNYFGLGIRGNIANYKIDY